MQDLCLKIQICEYNDRDCSRFPYLGVLILHVGCSANRVTRREAGSRPEASLTGLTFFGSFIFIHGTFAGNLLEEIALRQLCFSLVHHEFKIETDKAGWGREPSKQGAHLVKSVPRRHFLCLLHSRPFSASIQKL